VPAPALAWSPPGVRYAIDVRLDTNRQLLDGWVTIGYRSGADSALSALWLHAYPNAFSSHRSIYGREAERFGEDYALRFAPPEDRGWMTLDSASVDGIAAAVRLEETLARVDLPQPLAPGDSVAMRLHFRVHIPRVLDRFGRSRDGYSMGQWYPKIVVRDRDGWALDPFHYFPEFYGEFAEYDVAVTLPDEYWVGATGSLISTKGGTNEIPLQHPPPERVTVRLQTVAAGLGATGTSSEALWIEPARGDPIPVAASGAAAWRVPRGAPVHYRYAWRGEDGRSRWERDGEGRAGPLRFLTAWGDTSITDTLGAAVLSPAPSDSTLGSLKTLRFHASGVHDFGWVASPRYVRADTVWAGVAVRALVFREDSTAWSDALSLTVRGLEHHARLAGPYTWPTFTSAEASVAGGAMEYPMLTMNDPEITSGETEWLDATLAHESAHSWFYGMAGNDERRDAWLDEGFAQFLENDYVDEYYPRGNWRWRDRFRWVAPSSNAMRAERALLQHHYARDEQPPAWPADASPSYAAYSIAAYDRPAVMLRSLRAVWGRDTFEAFLKDLFRCGRGRHLVPDDVYASANAMAGAGADAMIRPWIETTDLPDVALGAVRRERTAGGWRTTVHVRRKGGIAMPVPVEAVYDDGSRETKWTPTDRREGTVVFDSPRRMSHAEIDPHSEVFDAYRLDNRRGAIPPMRWSPIFDVATPRAMTVLYGPTLWHGTREGMRLGGWVDGRYLPSQDFPRGIRSFEAGLSVGTEDGSLAWRAGYGRRVPQLGARGAVRLLAAGDAGLRRQEVTLSNWITESGRRRPWRLWSLTLQHLDRDDGARVVVPDSAFAAASVSRTVSAELALGLRTRGPRRSEAVEMSWRHGEAVGRRSGGVARSYDRGVVAFRQSIALGPRASRHVSWRIVGARAWRAAPADRLFDAAQSMPLETLDRFYWNAGGPLRESEHFWAEGGGGLRGYVGRGIVGDRLLAGSIEVRDDRWPLSVFLDVGTVGADSSAASSRDRPTLADAGIGWTAGPVRIYAPLWVGTPPPGESPLSARWVVAFDLTDPRWR